MFGVVFAAHGVAGMLGCHVMTALIRPQQQLLSSASTCFPFHYRPSWSVQSDPVSKSQSVCPQDSRPKSLLPLVCAGLSLEENINGHPWNINGHPLNPAEISMIQPDQISKKTKWNIFEIKLNFQWNTKWNSLKIQLEFNSNFNGIPVGSLFIQLKFHWYVMRIEVNWKCLWNFNEMAMKINLKSIWKFNGIPMETHWKSS